MKNNIQKYVCCAKDCNGLAELNLDEKKFDIIQNHSISPKFHIKYNDDKPIKFMKKRKLEEMHIKQNDNNGKFHNWCLYSSSTLSCCTSLFLDNI